MWSELNGRRARAGPNFGVGNCQASTRQTSLDLSSARQPRLDLSSRRSTRPRRNRVRSERRQVAHRYIGIARLRAHGRRATPRHEHVARPQPALQAEPRPIEAHQWSRHGTQGGSMVTP